MSLIQSIYKQIMLDYPKDNPTLLKCLIAKFLNPSYSVVFTYRVEYYLFHSKRRILQLIASRKRMRLIFNKNCDISFLATIGNKLRLPHPIGVVVGTGVRIGNNVTIFQNVTLGSHGKKNEKKRYPIVEDNVTIYTDSIIIGDVTIGENAIIGAKTLMNIDVPANSIAVGIPCKIINRK